MKKYLSKISISIFIALIAFMVTAFVLPCLPAQAAGSSPECWGVFVGVADYQYINDLTYTVDDAREFYQILSPVWGISHTKLLLDSQASKADILAAISWMAANAGTNDTVIFTFSGHGSDNGAFCPYDYSFASTGISAAELSNALNSIPASKIVVILDICYAGKFQASLSKNGRVLLLACRSNEFSSEDGRLQNGVFSYYLLLAFANFDKADTNHDYELSAEEIFQYAGPLTTNYEPDQHPVLDDQFIGNLALLAEFIFALNINLPSGTNILTVDGVNYTSFPSPLLWAPGISHTLTVPEVVNSGSDTRYVFAGWNDGDISNTKVISKGYYTADYDREFLLSLISAYGNPTGAGWYIDSSTATFSVTPSIETSDTKHIFIGWSGDYSGTSATVSLVVDAPKLISANWRNEYLLTLNSEYGDPTGTGWYNEGQKANVSVTPEDGFIIRHVFDGWSGDVTGAQASVGVTMNSPKVITAIWRTDYLQLYILIIVVVVLGGGITTTVVLVRRKGTTPPIPPVGAAAPPAPPPPPAPNAAAAPPPAAAAPPPAPPPKPPPIPPPPPPPATPPAT